MYILQNVVHEITNPGKHVKCDDKRIHIYIYICTNVLHVMYLFTYKNFFFSIYLIYTTAYGYNYVPNDVFATYLSVDSFL